MDTSPSLPIKSDVSAVSAHLGRPSRRSHTVDAARSHPDNGKAISHQRLALHPSATARRTELRLPPGLTLDSWQRIGQQIFLITDSAAWWLGDWIVFGEDTFPDRYQEAITRTSLNYQTLRNYAWIARKFDPSRRRDKLSFQHHVEVARLSSEDQNIFLDRAERMHWSRNELRHRVRQHLRKQVRSAETKIVSVQLELNPDRVARWQEAANHAGCPLPEWIASVADHAAETIPPCEGWTALDNFDDNGECSVREEGGEHQ